MSFFWKVVVLSLRHKVMSWAFVIGGCLEWNHCSFTFEWDIWEDLRWNKILDGLYVLSGLGALEGYPQEVLESLAGRGWDGCMGCFIRLFPLWPFICGNAYWLLRILCEDFRNSKDHSADNRGQKSLVLCLLLCVKKVCHAFCINFHQKLCIHPIESLINLVQQKHQCQSE